MNNLLRNNTFSSMANDEDLKKNNTVLAKKKFWEGGVALFHHLFIQELNWEECKCTYGLQGMKEPLQTTQKQGDSMTNSFVVLIYQEMMEGDCDNLT